MYLSDKLHKPISIGTLVTATKPKSKYNFRAAAIQ
jgi:hypothetical protein